MNDIRLLENKARWLRREVLEAIVSAKKGHIGGTYSCADLLVAMYYAGGIHFDPKNPNSAERDYFIMGKGHACLALFTIFRDLGWISPERFKEYATDGGSLGAQLDTNVPSMEYNTGSLGHALGICAGMALSAQLDGRSNRAFAMMGDAECDEGSVWEAIVFAGRHKLKNLIGIIDRNCLSVTETREDDLMFDGFTLKMKHFGWDCLEIDGHSFPEILMAFEKARNTEKPLMIVAKTVKGKGVSFMENEVKWHHSLLSAEELEKARKELS